MSSSWNWPTKGFESARLLPDGEGNGVADRQNRVPGFRTGMLAKLRVLLIGAGGLGSAIAGPLARKGVGKIDICDHDLVELTNLNRQHFYGRDLYKPKAIRLAANAAREGKMGSWIVGHHVGFDGESAAYLSSRADVALCCVDNNETRALASRVFREAGKPVIFTAVNEAADFGWLFVQEPEGACPGCVFPRLARAGEERQPCRPVPAVLDILQVMGGMVLYAVDSLVMEKRRRDWNFHSVHLVGSTADVIDRVPARAGCRLCGHATEPDG